MKITTKSFLISIIITAFSLNVHGQLPWELVNPKPSYENGMDIQFVSNNTGFILNGMQLLKTTNRGLTWQVAKTINSGNGYDNNFGKDISIRNSIGFIVGTSDYVLKSVDKGETWLQIVTPKYKDKKVDYHTVNIIDDNTIILSGYYDMGHSLILKSTNGGITWNFLELPYPTKTQFRNSLVGHALSSDGKIRKTIDGGVTWKTTFIPNLIPGDNKTLYFATDNLGFAVVTNMGMLRTTDAGETWKQIPNLTDTFNSIYFVNQTTGYAVADYGFIYKTTDGGNTWKTNAWTGKLNLYSIHFIDNNIGFAAGFGGIIMKTINAGATWEQHSPTYDYILKIKFINDNIGFALSSELLRTDDAGNQWKKISFPSLSYYPRCDDFYFVNKDIGYSYDSVGIIGKTIDGGVTWTRANDNGILESQLYSALYFIDENIGFLSGLNAPYTLKTTDGGKTWQKIENFKFNKFQFLNSQVGYATSNGILYKTIDGGNNWKHCKDTVGTFHFTDANNGYVTSSVSMQKTTNGGISWSPTSSYPKDGNSMYTKFHDMNTGYILKNSAGSDATTIYKTTDGAKTWNQTYFNWSKVSMDVTNTNIFVAGPYGRILKNVKSVTLDTDDFSYSNSNIKTYPNPTSSYVNISSEQDFMIDSLELYDIQGNALQVKSNINGPNNLRLDLTNSASGIYILRLKLSNGATEIRKIIVQ